MGALPLRQAHGREDHQRSPERSEAELHIREELCNRRGVIHGGALMGWADTMGGMTASAGLADGQRTATIESKTNFFAPIPKGDTARAVCTPLHTGRTTIVLQTDITRGDGKLAAIVTQTQIVLPAPGERPGDTSDVMRQSPFVARGSRASSWLACTGSGRPGRADFYAGKQIKFVIRTGVGGSYDSYSRLLGPPYRQAHPGQSGSILRSTCRAAAASAPPTTSPRSRRRTAPSSPC